MGCDTVLCVGQLSLDEEDLGVVMKILVENIGEGSKEDSMDVRQQVAQGKATLMNDGYSGAHL